MQNSPALVEAQDKFKRADHLLKVVIGILVVFFVGMFVFIAGQLYVVQNTIATNQKVNAQGNTDRFAKYTQENELQHEKTQQYVKCIAQTLLLPIDQRTNAVFDQCSVPPATAPVLDK